MIFERIKSEGIAHNSYFLGSRDEAAVIDPRRDCRVYQDLANENGMKLRYIFETHRNEDYVTGSMELNNITGATIYHGPRSDWGYGQILNDGQEFQIGNLKIVTVYTPGHTDESVSYTLADSSSGEAIVMVFTGDTLFVGDVGRTDLYGPDEVERLASNLYDSIFSRLLPLGDGVILCPAHGAGSVCGLSITDRDQSTLGIERIQNPLLGFKSKRDFIEHKLAERPEKPPYFREMEKLNLEGPPVLGNLPEPDRLSPEDFRGEMEHGAIVVDTREPSAFAGAHIKGAYNIWLNGLPEFAGWVLPCDTLILLVLQEHGHLGEATRYLIRLGYDRIAGYLEGGIGSWYVKGFPIESLPVLPVHELMDKIEKGEELTLLDVRGGSEWQAGHIGEAVHIYVGHLEWKLNEIPGDKPVAVSCSVGNRAGLGASILLRNGYERVCNVLGGIEAWTAAGYPVTREQPVENGHERRAYRTAGHSNI